MSEPFKSSQGSVFFQVTPDATPVYLGCIDVGDIPSPSGDQTLFYCRNRDGILQAIGSSIGVPANGTTTLTIPMSAKSDVIDTLRTMQTRSNCKFTVFVMTDSCGKLGVFANYERGVVLHDVTITNFNRQNLAMREADDMVMRVLDLSYYGVYDLRILSVARQTIAETRNLNDIVFDLDTRCAGDCGAAKNPDDVGYTVGSGTAGSPTSDADVWLTTNAGSAWANATGAVPSPFSGGDIKSAVLFQMDKNTWRLLVASIAKAGSAQVAYSDDSGATWTTVTVGSTAWEGAQHADALFAWDRDHIYYASDHGRVYFSADAGVTWTSQSSALTASGARALNSVWFSDYDNGFAAGSLDTLIRTLDGGSNWTAITTYPTTADNITALWVKSKFELLVGSNAGQLFHSLKRFHQLYS